MKSLSSFRFVGVKKGESSFWGFFVWLNGDSILNAFSGVVSSFKDWSFFKGLDIFGMLLFWGSGRFKIRCLVGVLLGDLIAGVTFSSMSFRSFSAIFGARGILLASGSGREYLCWHLNAPR